MCERIAVLWLAGAALVLGGMAPGSDYQGRIDRLVRQLGSPRFEEREEASRVL